MTDELRRTFDRATAASHERQFVRGRIGRRNADGSISTSVSDRPGFVYVTLTGQGSQTVDIALGVGSGWTPNLPVKMKRVDGVLVIKELDDAPGVLSAFAGGGSVGAAPKHHHLDGSGLEYEHPAFWFSPGRVLWAGSGVTVRIRDLHYRYNGAEKYYAGGTLDLTSNLPSTTDKWAWIVVGIDPATNAAVAVTGDEYDAQVDLTAARIADVDMLDYIPLGAVRAQNGDTALSSRSRYADARHWLDERLRLDDLTNVTLTTPADGEALVYDDGSGEWVNAPNASDVAAQIVAAVAKTTPHDDDTLGLVDSEAANVLKKLTWANLKATLQAAFNSIFLVKAGLSGGQLAYGGTDSGDDLTLRSTSHGTKGDVILADDGGNIGLGTASPDTKVHVVDSGIPARAERTTSFTNSAIASLSLKATSSDNIVDGFGPQFIFEVNDSGLSGLNIIGRVGALRSGADNSGALVFYTTNAGSEGERFRINNWGRIGHGVTIPQLFHHSHDGTTGYAWGTVSIPSGTSVTVIPNGTGDVTDRLFYRAIVKPSGSAGVSAANVLFVGAGDDTLYNIGGNTVVIRVTAGGAIEVQRTAGTLTYTVSLDLFWQ